METHIVSHTHLKLNTSDIHKTNDLCWSMKIHSSFQLVLIEEMSSKMRVKYSLHHCPRGGHECVICMINVCESGVKDFLHTVCVQMFLKFNLNPFCVFECSCIIFCVSHPSPLAFWELGHESVWSNRLSILKLTIKMQVSSQCLVVTVRLPRNQRRLQEVTAPWEKQYQEAHNSPVTPP